MSQPALESPARTGLPWRILRGVLKGPENEIVTPIDRITTVVSRLAMFLIAVIVAIIVFEVTARYVFGAPTLWANELSLWLGSVIYMTAGVYTMQRRGHIRITAIYDLVPRYVRYAFDFVAMLTVVGFAVLLIYPSFGNAFETLLNWERYGSEWNPPIPATVKPLVIIVVFLIAIQCVNNFVVDLILDIRKHRDVSAGTGKGS